MAVMSSVDRRSRYWLRRNARTPSVIRPGQSLADWKISPLGVLGAHCPAAQLMEAVATSISTTLMLNPNPATKLNPSRLFTTAESSALNTE